MSQNLPDESWMTEAELAAWNALGVAANAMFALPVLHPSDNPETVHDIRNLQNRLLQRAAWRKP